MSLQFNAESIFEIGVQIETNGRAFYLKVAENSADEMVKSLFTELAEWENAHIELFERLRNELPDSMRDDAIFDPDNQYVEYLKAAADNHVFLHSVDIEQLATQHDTPAKAIALALSFEKDSIVYYTTMKKVVADYLGKEKIDTLIDEELNHIAILTRKKQQL